MGSYIETTGGGIYQVMGELKWAKRSKAVATQASNPRAQETEFQDSQGYTEKPCVQKTKGCGGEG